MLALRGSYFFSIVIALEIAKARRRPKYLSPAANSLEIRIAGRQPKYLSIKYLRPSATSLDFRIADGRDTDSIPIYSTMIPQQSLTKKTLFGVHAQVSLLFCFKQIAWRCSTWVSGHPSWHPTLGFRKPALILHSKHFLCNMG